MISGASGFLGSHLADAATAAEHDVVRLVRRPAGPGESQWDPYAGAVDASVIGSADVVVNLAGSPAMGNPHSKKWASRLCRSRVSTTSVLARAIAAAANPPAFLAGNAVGWYGDQGDTVLTEQSPSTGGTFFTGVTAEWQAATQPAVDAGARVCLLRTAPVLDRSAMPLKAQRLQFLAGLGGRIGSGEQYFPVISLRDWVAAALFLGESDVAGPVNLCCPKTPTNAEYTRALADQLHRPAFATVPAAIVKRTAGRMASEALGSMRLVPQVLLDAGLEFSDPDVEAVLATGLA